MKNRRSMYVPSVDLYGPIHKGLRWALSRTLNRIGATSPASAADFQIAAVLTEVEDVVVALESHIAHEEELIHPAIELRRPGATKGLEDDHADHANLLAGLRVLLAALRSGSKDTRPALWRALYLRFSEITADTLIHMIDEEEITQPLLEELYSADELEEIHARLLASIDPPEMLAALRIMLPANEFEFRYEMLNGAKHSMDGNAFAGMFAAATIHLSQAEIYELATRLLRVAAA